MIRSIITTLLVFFYFTSSAEIYIVLSSQDCSNCLRYLEDVKQLPNQKDIYYIQSKRSRIDSAKFVKINGLESQSGHIIYSDSLFNQYKLKKSNNQSAIVIKSQTGPSYFSFPLIDYNTYSELLLHHLKDTSGYEFSEQIFGQWTVSRVIQNKFYVMDETLNEVNVYSLLNSNKLYTITLTDSLLIKAYQATWGTEFKERFETSVGPLNQPEKWKRRNNKLVHAYFHPNGKTIYVITEHTYLWKEIDGKGLDSGFIALNKFEEGKLINTYLIEGFLGHPKDIKTYNDLIGNGLYNGYNFTITKDDNFYLEAITQDKFDSLPYFFVKMKQDKTSYKVDKIFESKYDPYYLEKKSIDESFTGGTTTTDKDYFMTCYGEYLHHLPSGERIRLSRFNINRSDMNVIYSFRKSGDTLYILANREKESANYYYVYDLKTNQVIFSKRIIAYNDDDFVAGTFFDDFDYRYIYLPISPNSFKKVKMYEP